MLRIEFSEKYCEEKNYVAQILFGEFLGLDYNVAIISDNVYNINLSKGSFIRFTDCFFHEKSRSHGYESSMLPEKPLFSKNRFTPEPDIPILFGDDSFGIMEGANGKQILCGIDVFACIFFMLTRWEEGAIVGFDEHGRSSAKCSTSFKINTLHRPIVNEYVEMIWSMLVFLGYNHPRKKRTFELVVTHDVDQIRYWKGPLLAARLVGEYMLKKGRPLLAAAKAADFITTSLRLKKDPYDTFDWLMDLSEARNLQSRFYFLSNDNEEYDFRYSYNEKFIKDLICRITLRGHVVGLHAGYLTFDNPERLAKERQRLEDYYNLHIVEGRQHYLRFRVPDTWSAWESAGMEIDSTCGYFDHIGFRCGTGDKFSVFDIRARKALRLKERPLVVMDGTMFHYQKINAEKSYSMIKLLLDKAVKYKMEMTILFHNSSFVVDKWPGWKNLYSIIME